MGTVKLDLAMGKWNGYSEGKSAGTCNSNVFRKIKTRYRKQDTENKIQKEKKSHGSNYPRL